MESEEIDSLMIGEKEPRSENEITIKEGNFFYGLDPPQESSENKLHSSIILKSINLEIK
jgi:hypothetical protein